VRKWLRAGVLEDGELRVSAEGTPQGAVISPLLANVYLHYVFDLWAHRWRRREACGQVIIVRYADDSAPRRRTGGRKSSVQPCCTSDGGRPPEAGVQAQASNHRQRRRSRAGVVSVAEKAEPDSVRYGSGRRTQVNR
jgi:hypothetical protein